jgi:hypothetical protein
MKYKKDLLIFLALITLGIIFCLSVGRDSVVDFQVYDTYYVISNISLTVLIFGPLIFITFLIRSAIRKFRSVGANFGLLIGLIIMLPVTVRIIALMASFSASNVTVRVGGVGATGMWIFFGVLLFGIAALTMRTIMLLRRR